MKKINNNIKSFLIVMLMIVGVVTKAQEPGGTRPVMAANKVAILPITYVGEGNQVKMDEMRYRLQNIAFLYLKDEAVELKFQTPAETNALLLRKGVTEANFRQFTPKELAAMLEVEYVLTGMVLQEVTGSSSMNNRNKRTYDNGREKEVIEHTKNMQELNTHIDLSIYNDKGDMIYSKSRRSILTGVDAYKNGIQYLLKRAPLYKR